MGIKAVISLVSIEACGLYSSNGRNFKYGDINSVLVNLSQWADKKPLGLTKTFEGDDKHNPCYLYDIYTDQEDWLIAMWNETESNDGTVASVDSQAIVGKASISSTNLPKNNIPGFPTYFWVLPKEKLVASIKFEYRKTGVQELALYLQSFLAFFSRYAVTVPSKDNNALYSEILGYIQHSGDAPENLRPRVKLKEVRNPGEIEHIKANALSVTKIVCKTTLLPSIPLHKTLWQKVNEVLNSKTEKKSFKSHAYQL